MKGVEGPLQQLAQQAVLLQPGRDCSVQEVKESAAAVFGTGFFSSCATKANDTREGTEIFIEVGPASLGGEQGSECSGGGGQLITLATPLLVLSHRRWGVTHKPAWLLGTDSSRVGRRGCCLSMLVCTGGLEDLGSSDSILPASGVRA